MAITCAFCWRSVSRRVKFGVLIKVFSNKIIVPLVAQGLPSSFFSSLLRKFTIYCSVSTVIPYWQKYKMQTMHRKSRIWEMKNDNYTNCLTKIRCVQCHMRDTRENVLSKFIKLCTETPCWCPFEGTNMEAGKQQKLLPLSSRTNAWIHRLRNL